MVFPCLPKNIECQQKITCAQLLNLTWRNIPRNLVITFAKVQSLLFCCQVHQKTLICCLKKHPLVFGKYVHRCKVGICPTEKKLKNWHPVFYPFQLSSLLGLVVVMLFTACILKTWLHFNCEISGCKCFN